MGVAEDVADGHDDAVVFGCRDQIPALFQSRSQRFFDENIIFEPGECDCRFQMHPVLRRDDDGIGEFRAVEQFVPVPELVFRRNMMSLRDPVAEKIARFRDCHDFCPIGECPQMAGIDTAASAADDDHRCFFHAVSCL